MIAAMLRRRVTGVHLTKRRPRSYNLSVASHDIFHIASRYQPLMRRVGLDAELMFSHPQVKVWRALADRENCTLDASLDDGSPIRLHVKRYQPVRGARTPAEEELAGFRLLEEAGIPAAVPAGWGKLADGRSFLLTEDLAGYRDAEKLVESGFPFEKLLAPTADLAGRLHRAGLHHRDLYLCHFFARPDEHAIDVKLIDVARVRRLPALFTRQRWIVKDLAQFWYSTLALPVTDLQRDVWLARYSSAGDKSENISTLRRQIQRKVARIARHDQRLRRVQPGRNVSIPQD
jgi:heptose I phosphotransferase